LPVVLAGAWELTTAAVIYAERNSLRIDKHGHHFTSRERRGRSHFAFESPADAPRDILNGDEQLCEVMRLPGVGRMTAVNSFWATPVEER